MCLMKTIYLNDYPFLQTAIANITLKTNINSSQSQP